MSLKHLWWSIEKQHVSRRRRQSSGTKHVPEPEFGCKRLEIMTFPPKGNGEYPFPAEHHNCAWTFKINVFDVILPVD